VELGVRVLDAFTPCRQGQRLGLFAGPGVGKSTLLGMLARQARCDTVVAALIGERGREVREFIEDELGEAGRQRAVVVVATPDDPSLLRREAAYAAVTHRRAFPRPRRTRPAARGQPDAILHGVAGDRDKARPTTGPPSGSARRGDRG
jgi:flagellar biosynthesis/type III secretory pathway ATPase